MGNLEHPSSDELAPLDQFAFGAESGVKIESGGWVRYNDVQNAMAFVTGYLGEHKGMLEDLGAHPKVLAAVQHIIDEIKKL